MEKVIEAAGLSFSYEDRLVFKNINFDLRRGDFAGIIGPNGSGKSTLLKLILGLLTPSGGTVKVLGLPAARFRDWPRLGYVAQKNQLRSGFPASVCEAVSANLYSGTGFLHILSGRQKEKVREVLNTVGLEDRAKTPIGSLSGGQQQRVHLARVLVSDPEVLLMDEPASGMDTGSEASMYELLHTLNEERGITIAMVTHDISAITSHAKRLFCMGGGTMIEHDVSECLSSDFLSRLYGRNVHAHVHGREAW